MERRGGQTQINQNMSIFMWQLVSISVPVLQQTFYKDLFISKHSQNMPAEHTFSLT